MEAKIISSTGTDVLSERSKSLLKERYILNMSFLEAISNIKKDEIFNLEEIYTMYLNKSNEISQDFEELDTQLNGLSVDLKAAIVKDGAKDLTVSSNIKKTPELSPLGDSKFATSAIPFQSLNKAKKHELPANPPEPNSAASRPSTLQSRPFAPKIPSKLSGLIDNTSNPAQTKEKRSREPEDSDQSTDSFSKDKRIR